MRTRASPKPLSLFGQLRKRGVRPSILSVTMAMLDDASSSALIPSRASKKLTPQQQADNAIRDNFPGWASEDLYCKLVDGLTLYAVVLADKKRNHEKKGAVTMGGKYYDILRQKYRADDDVRSLLKATDANARIRPALFEAMRKALRKPPMRGPLQSYVDCCAEATQAEVVGILRWVASMRPSLSSEQLQCGLSGMNCAARLQWAEQYKG